MDLLAYILFALALGAAVMALFLLIAAPTATLRMLTEPDAFGEIEEPEYHIDIRI